MERLKCRKHPKYKAIRYPYSECPMCLEIWERKQKWSGQVDKKVPERLVMKCPDCNTGLEIKDATIFPQSTLEKYASVLEGFCSKCGRNKVVSRGYENMTDWFRDVIVRDKK